MLFAYFHILSPILMHQFTKFHHQASSCARMHSWERWWGPQRTKLCKYGHWVKSLLGKLLWKSVNHRDDWCWLPRLVDWQPLSSKHLYGYSASSSAWNPGRFRTIWQKSPLSQKFRQLTAWKLPSPHNLRAMNFERSAIPDGRIPAPIQAIDLL